ncbi:MAG TPA: rod shape-determining protein RodA, partial [Methylophaga aminisulfidivorans]|nr:rod shape-determining protein RodA [Methylophaga aminisulfidivorans]
MNNQISDRRRSHQWQFSFLLRKLHLDPILLMGLFILLGSGLLLLYSAGGQDMGLIVRQLIRMGMALSLMFVIAQIDPDRLRDNAYWLYVFGLVLLVAVLLFGHEGKGAQRWLNLGFFRFQPSEIIKLAVPILVAAYLAERPLPPTAWRMLIAF